MARTSLTNNDSREFELLYERGLLDRTVARWITQSDLRILLKHLKGRNNRIEALIKGFIEEVDDAEKRPTDWAIPPRRH